MLQALTLHCPLLPQAANGMELPQRCRIKMPRKIEQPWIGPTGVVGHESQPCTFPLAGFP